MHVYVFICSFQPKPIETQVISHHMQRYAVWFGGSMLASTVRTLIYYTLLSSSSPVKTINQKCFSVRNCLMLWHEFNARNFLELPFKTLKNAFQKFLEGCGNSKLCSAVPAKMRKHYFQGLIGLIFTFLNLLFLPLITAWVLLCMPHQSRLWWTWTKHLSS